MTAGVSRPLIAAVILALVAGPLAAREYRSREGNAGIPTGASLPFHGPQKRRLSRVPLACGGPDAVSNIQWQTIRDARAKDRWERKACGR
jgi:hypothetical protein